MTFSIVARSADPQMFGVAMASSSLAVASRCAHVRAGAGAVATQNVTDPSLGPRILEALGGGAVAKRALEDALRTTPFAAFRQLLVVGRGGAPIVHSGANTLGIVSSAVGMNAAAAGNLLSGSEVPASMVAAFDESTGHLGARLLRALRAGADRGGEAGPIHSAGLLIVRDVTWPIVDLRVDWTAGDPVAELTSIWEIYAPQIDDYVCRAIDPTQAPSFGVPGDM